MGVNLPSRFALFPNLRLNSSSGIGGPSLSIAHYSVFYTPFLILRQENPLFLTPVPLFDQHKKDRSFVPTMRSHGRRAQRRGRGVLRGPVYRARSDRRWGGTSSSAERARREAWKRGEDH